MTNNTGTHKSLAASLASATVGQDYTHRHHDGTTVHIMQYHDLARCGQHYPTADWTRHLGEIGLGSGYRKCVACGTI